MVFKIDSYQGNDINEIPFGYIEEIDSQRNERGGWFFKWFETDEATIASIEEAGPEYSPEISDISEAMDCLRERLGEGLRDLARRRSSDVPESVDTESAC